MKPLCRRAARRKLQLKAQMVWGLHVSHGGVRELPMGVSWPCAQLKLTACCSPCRTACCQLRHRVAAANQQQGKDGRCLMEVSCKGTGVP